MLNVLTIKNQKMYIFKCLNIEASKILRMYKIQDAVNMLCAHRAAGSSHFPRLQLECESASHIGAPEKFRDTRTACPRAWDSLADTRTPSHTQHGLGSDLRHLQKLTYKAASLSLLTGM